MKNEKTEFKAEKTTKTAEKIIHSVKMIFMKA